MHNQQSCIPIQQDKGCSNQFHVAPKGIAYHSSSRCDKSKWECGCWHSENRTRGKGRSETQRLCLITDCDKSGFLKVFLFHNIIHNEKKRCWLQLKYRISSQAHDFDLLLKKNKKKQGGWALCLQTVPSASIQVFTGLTVLACLDS